MEFRFLPEEEDLRSALGDFVKREMAERIVGPIPGALLEQMGDLGFFSMRIPEAYGGQPSTWVDLGVLVEELAKGDVNVAHLAMITGLAALLLAEFGGDETKAAALRQLAGGRKFACLAVTEAGAGSDLGSLAASAVQDGDRYRLNGTKSPASFGLFADYAVVFAKADAGVTAFWVPLDAPGIRKSPVPGMGLRSSGLAELTFEDVVVPASHRLGLEGDGLRLNEASGLLGDAGQLLSALACLGLAQSALRQAVAYAKARVAFGRPIVQFEAVSGKIAEHSTHVEAARWLCYRGLALKDRGAPSRKEAAMCGWWCPQVAYKAIEDALLIHGHGGYCDEYPFEQMVRDVVAFEFLTGSAQLSKLRIAQSVVGGAAIPPELAALAS